MEYLGEEYLKKRIEQNQKFLVSLLNLHIGNYYPLRKWLGIAYKGKIDEVSHLSIGYNTKYFKKGKKWYKQQTREYQHPDLGYKLNLVLDRIPQLVLLPALLQPAFRLASVLLFSLTTTTYQPTTVDANINNYYPNTAFSDGTNRITIGYQANINTYYTGLLNFDISDIPDNVTFSQGDISLAWNNNSGYNGTLSRTVYARRVLQTAWTASATWDKYDGTNAWGTAGCTGTADRTTTNQIANTYIPTAYWDTWSGYALIQDCFNTQSKHVNVVLQEDETVNAYKGYYSKNETTNISLRPKLTVTYTVSLNPNFFLFFNN